MLNSKGLSVALLVQRGEKEMAYYISLVATDVDAGEVFVSCRIMQITSDGEPDFLSAVEMLHDELIDTEALSEEYCQHR